jgi:hypothetical protein
MGLVNNELIEKIINDFFHKTHIEHYYFMDLLESCQ